MSNEKLASLHKKLTKSYGDDIAQSVVVALLERKKPLTNPPAWANRLGYKLKCQIFKRESVNVPYSDTAEGKRRVWVALGHKRYLPLPAKSPDRSWGWSEDENPTD